ncbi:MAG: CHRD domain-containing protein [Cyanobacteria bacterium P01_G01_bin.49]
MNTLKRLLPLTAFGITFNLLPTVFTTSATAAQLFQATLNSDQEVAPGGATNSPATGFANLELNDAGTELAYSITFSGVDFSDLAPVGSPANPLDTATLLHFHEGSREVNGPVVFGQFGPAQDLDDLNTTFNPDDESTTVSGIWDLGDPASVPLSTFVPGLLATAPGEDTALYLNLHSANDPGGIIRGQIIATPVPEPSSLGFLAIAGVSFLSYQLRKKQST